MELWIERGKSFDTGKKVIAVLYTGDIKEIDKTPLIKKLEKQKKLAVVYFDNDKEIGTIVCKSKWDGVKEVHRDSYIIYNEKYDDVYCLSKEKFEEKYKLLNKSIDEGNVNELPIKVRLDTKEFKDNLNTLVSHFNIVAEGIKEVTPVLKDDLKDKINLEAELETNDREVKINVFLDIKEALETLMKLRREVNKYKEQRFESLKVVTEEQFILKHLFKYKSRKEIVALWNKISNGYNFILEVDGDYYSVEYLNNMLMDCDRCKYNLNNECETCEYTNKAVLYSTKSR